MLPVCAMCGQAGAPAQGTQPLVALGVLPRGPCEHASDTVVADQNSEVMELMGFPLDFLSGLHAPDMSLRKFLGESFHVCDRLPRSRRVECPGAL